MYTMHNIRYMCALMQVYGSNAGTAQMFQQSLAPRHIAPRHVAQNYSSSQQRANHSRADLIPGTLQTNSSALHSQPHGSRNALFPLQPHHQQLRRQSLHSEGVAGTTAQLQSVSASRSTVLQVQQLQQQRRQLHYTVQNKQQHASPPPPSAGPEQEGSASQGASSWPWLYE
jgi:hypothetical protein